MTGLRIWTQDEFSYYSDTYQIENLPIGPKHMLPASPSVHCAETDEQAAHNGVAADSVQRHEELLAAPDGGFIGKCLHGEAGNALTTAQC